MPGASFVFRCATLFTTKTLARSHLLQRANRLPHCEPMHAWRPASVKFGRGRWKTGSFASVIAIVITLAQLLAPLLYFQTCWIPKHSLKSGHDWAYRKSICPACLVYLLPA